MKASLLAALKDDMHYFYLRNPILSIRHCQTDAVWRAHVTECANNSLSNTFTFTEKYEMERCEAPVHFETIDWNAIPFGDEEWCYALNRHTFLLNNALTFAITRDRKYYDNWVRLFRDFNSHTKLDEMTAKRSWRSLECGIRVENYIRSIEIFSAMGMMDENLLEELTVFLRKHRDYLISEHTDFHRISNWGVLQDHGLFLSSLFLDDEESMKEAIRRLDEEMALQTLSDGMHWEQSSMYHAEVLHCAMDTVMIADRNSIAIPQSLKENTHALALALGRSLRPDGKCYLFGDSDEIDMRDMMASASVIFSDPILSYYAGTIDDTRFYLSHELDTVLPEPKKPEEPLVFMKSSGNAFLTIGERSALRLHCGPTGSGHGHIDPLHFDLYSNGEVIITDTGRYTYTSTKERYALKGAYGHNTIILDGKEPVEMFDSWASTPPAEPVFTDALTNGAYSYLSAMHLGYSGTAVRRSILTLSNRFIIIADDIITDQDKSVELLFHLDEGTKIDGDGKRFHAAKNNAKITMLFMHGNAAVSSYPLSKRYNEMLESPLVTVRGTAMERSTFITVLALGSDDFEANLIPLKKPLTGFNVPKSYGMGLIIRDGEDEYSVALMSGEYPEKGFIIKAGNAEAFGRVFVRKNNEKTVVLKY